MTETLKPCPFCGGSATSWSQRPSATVWCNYSVNCGASTELHEPGQDAITAWNTRQPVADEVMVERIVMAMREAGDWQWEIVLTGDGGYEFTTRTQKGWLANGAASIQSLTTQRNAERAKVAELVEGLGELLGETTGAKVGDGDGHTYLTADPPSARMLIKARALIERMKP